MLASISFQIFLISIMPLLYIIIDDYNHSPLITMHGALNALFYIINCILVLVIFLKNLRKVSIDFARKKSQKQSQRKEKTRSNSTTTGSDHDMDRSNNVTNNNNDNNDNHKENNENNDNQIGKKVNSKPNNLYSNRPDIKSKLLSTYVEIMTRCSILVIFAVSSSLLTTIFWMLFAATGSNYFVFQMASFSMISDTCINMFCIAFQFHWNEKEYRTLCNKCHQCMTKLCAKFAMGSR